MEPSDGSPFILNSTIQRGGEIDGHLSCLSHSTCERSLSGADRVGSAEQEPIGADPFARQMLVWNTNLPEAMRHAGEGVEHHRLPADIAGPVRGRDSREADGSRIPPRRARAR